jgi:hypothetical protein
VMDLAIQEHAARLLVTLCSSDDVGAPFCTIRELVCTTRSTRSCALSDAHSPTVFTDSVQEAGDVADRQPIVAFLSG